MINSANGYMAVNIVWYKCCLKSHCCYYTNVFHNVQMLTNESKKMPFSHQILLQIKLALKQCWAWLQQFTCPWPLYAAWCRGVLPDLSATSRLHTCGSKAKAHPVAHLETAKCSGVCQNLSRELTSAFFFSKSSTAFWKKRKEIKTNKKTNNKIQQSSFRKSFFIFALKWNLTAFCEAAARCKGVSKPWSLALTLAPVEGLKRFLGEFQFFCTHY